MFEDFGGSICLPVKGFDFDIFDLSKINIESVNMNKHVESLFNQLAKEFNLIREDSAVIDLKQKLNGLIDTWNQYKDLPRFPDGKTVIRDDDGNTIGSQG